MLRKRLVGVITVRQGWAVQSFGYNRYLPLGKPMCIAENLDRWGADEILLQDIDSSRKDLGPNIELINQVAAGCLSTPIVYAGGIRSEAEAVAVVRAGVERICVDTLLRSNPVEVNSIAQTLGAQAVLASLPLAFDENNQPGWYCYHKKMVQPISKHVVDLVDNHVISEIVVIDKLNEGKPNAFNFSLLDFVNKLQVPLIIFGGISEPAQLETAFSYPHISAVAIGNFLNYKEHSIQKYKKQLSSAPTRPAFYHSRSLL